MSAGGPRALTRRAGAGCALGKIEVGAEPEEGTDGALLAAGHPTLTALRSVTEDEGRLVPDWLAKAERIRA